MLYKSKRRTINKFNNLAISSLDRPKQCRPEDVPAKEIPVVLSEEDVAECDLEGCCCGVGSVDAPWRDDWPLQPT